MRIWVAAVTVLARTELDAWHDVQIEVVGSEGVLRIHVECERRPHVLANIMEFLESTGMNADQVSIAYHGESQFVFDCVGSEVKPELLKLRSLDRIVIYRSTHVVSKRF